MTVTGNRYVGIHQYFFFVALLDPRVAPMLPKMMANVDFQLLMSDIINLMVDKAKTSKSSSTTTPLPSENVPTSGTGTPEPSTTPYLSNKKQAKRANE